MEQVKIEAAPAHQIQIEIVKAAPAEVDAGAFLTLKVRASCVSGCSLQGGRISVIDSRGDVAAEADMPLFDGTNTETKEFTAPVPAEPGRYDWTAVFSAPDEQSVLHPETSATFSFQVKPHLISLSVWGVPSPVSRGKKFKVKMGAKCSAGCSLAGLAFTVEDEARSQVAAGRLGEEVLPQTSGVYWTERELDAPDEEALHSWSVQCAMPELELPHRASPAGFSFCTAASPEHAVLIEVTNKYDKTPLADANIMLGSHRASTGKDGIARVEVPGGKQELCVVRIDYLTLRRTVEVAGDSTIKAEMEFFPEL